MPYYYISLTVRNERSALPDNRNGVRFEKETDIEIVWNRFRLKADELYGSQLANFDVVMISRWSKLYQQFAKTKGALKKGDNPIFPQDRA